MTVRSLCIYFPKTTRCSTGCPSFRIARMTHSYSAEFALPNSKFKYGFQIMHRRALHAAQAEAEAEVEAYGQNDTSEFPSTR